MQLETTLCCNQLSLPLVALVDSGADENFLDINLAAQAVLGKESLTVPLKANTLNNQLLAQVTHQTKPVYLILSGNHREHIQFHLISSPHASIVLGHLWLRTHNPHIDWSAGKILSWSAFFAFPHACSLLLPLGRSVFLLSQLNLRICPLCPHITTTSSRCSVSNTLSLLPLIGPTTAPSTQLTCTSTPFAWTPEFKRRFTAAPVLTHSDPPQQFVVEVDASDSRVGGSLLALYH